MILKFIGKNGSMGLIHGQKYNISIKNNGEYIWVYWQTGSCPYSSPQSFAENWR